MMASSLTKAMLRSRCVFSITFAASASRVDPARDTPELMKTYLSSFDPRIVGLTGTEEEIAAAAKAYKVYYRKVPTESGDYTMDHTASIFLMDSKGDFYGTSNFQEAQDVRRAKLRQLVRNG